MITLYDCATAPSPRRARILLAEKGVRHATVQVDLRAGEQLRDAYRRINPHGTVPALRTDDGLLLTDNAGIAAYLEARFPEPPLLGTTPRDKAEVASWNWRIEFEGLMAIADAMRNSAPAMANRALPGPVSEATGRKFAPGEFVPLAVGDQAAVTVRLAEAGDVLPAEVRVVDDTFWDRVRQDDGDDETAAAAA